MVLTEYKNFQLLLPLKWIHFNRPPQYKPVFGRLKKRDRENYTRYVTIFINDNTC